MNRNTINRLIFTAIGTLCLVAVLALLQAVSPAQALADTQCSGGNCWQYACNTSSDCGTNTFTGMQKCSGNGIVQDYVSYTCNNAHTQDANCTKSITSRFLQSCNSDQTCSGGTCLGGGGGYTNYTNSNSNYNSNYYNGGSYPINPYYTNNGTYTPQYARKCVGNNIFWFDNYSNQQALYQNCALTNQTCSNGLCVALTCANHNSKLCFNNSVYWYDSCSTQQELYQNCTSTGQTCQSGSCQTIKPATPKPAAPSPTAVATNSNVANNAITISMLAKNNAGTQDWSKNITASNNDTINFLLVIKNPSDKNIDNVAVQTDLANTLTASNVKVDNTDSKDPASRILLSTMPAKSSKAVSFNALVLAQTGNVSAQVTSQIAVQNSLGDFDTITISISPTSAAAPVNASTASLVDSPFTAFLKNWYIFGIIGLVLIALFVIIFRRLSSNV